MKIAFFRTMAVAAMIAMLGCNPDSKEKEPEPESTAEVDSEAETAPVVAAKKIVPITKPSAPVVAKKKAMTLVSGVMAPEITAKDTDGEVFNLSDYRGKVVMIDFWGDW